MKREIQDRAAQLLSLQGQVAIVTGAASGIGRGIALRLAGMGAFVAVLDIDEHKGCTTVAEIETAGGQSTFQKCDVRSAADCREVVDSICKRAGNIDILCNCAGVAIRKDVVELTESEWDLALDVTLKGIYLLSHEVIPHMIRGGGGSIINIGSGWSLKGGPRAAAYCAAKGGTVNLTRAMAIDHGKHNIRVNAISAGPINTLSARGVANLSSMLKFHAERAPLKRNVEPSEVGNTALFLCSDLASAITGEVIHVDCGFSIMAL